MKLLLGCGEQKLQGWLGVDCREDAFADVICDVRKLEFAPDESVDAIRAPDIAEHFRVDEIDDLFREWYRVLKPGALLYLKTPNLDRIAERILANDRVRLMIRNLVGGHRWGPDGSLDCHHWLFTPLTIREDLTKVGFHVISVSDELNMEICARKGAA